MSRIYAYEVREGDAFDYELCIETKLVKVGGWGIRSTCKICNTKV